MYIYHCQLISNRLTVNFSLILNTCKDSYTYNFFPSVSARGANVRAVNASGCTPLHDAVKRGDAQAVTELLMHNSDPMAKVTCGSVVFLNGVKLWCSGETNNTQEHRHLNNSLYNVDDYTNG